MATSTSVANQAIVLMGDNTPPVTGVAPTFDNSTAGVALQNLYAPCVATVMRQFAWDFARNSVALQLTGNAPVFGWTFEYFYPPNTIELWQVFPPPASVDPNNPLPINWNVANNIVGGVQTKVIQTNLANAQAVINNYPNESTWDPLFQEEVVRLLASELAMAIAGKPDTAQALFESAGTFGQLGMERPD